VFEDKRDFFYSALRKIMKSLILRNASRQYVSLYRGTIRFSSKRS